MTSNDILFIVILVMVGLLAMIVAIMTFKKRFKKRFERPLPTHPPEPGSYGTYVPPPLPSPTSVPLRPLQHKTHITPPRRRRQTLHSPTSLPLPPTPQSLQSPTRKDILGDLWKGDVIVDVGERNDLYTKLKLLKEEGWINSEEYMAIQIKRGLYVPPPDSHATLSPTIFYDGKLQTLELRPDARIWDVKDVVGIPSYHSIWYHGIEIDDDVMLADAGIGRNSQMTVVKGQPFYTQDMIRYSRAMKGDS